MSDTQVIKGIEFPSFQGPYRVYEFGDVRDGGAEHESNRIVVRVRRNRGVVDVIALKMSKVYAKYTVDMPTLGTNRTSSIAAAARFTFELNQVLKGCVTALGSEH